MFANFLKFIILLLVASSALSAAGQTPETSDGARYASPINIDAVMTEAVSDTSLTLAVSGQQSDGCDLPVQVVQDMTDDGLFIDIFREARQDVMCPAVMQPYQSELTIDGDFSLSALRDNPLYIEINESAYWLQVADDDRPELVPGQRSLVVLESLMVRAEDETLILSVQGILGTGCDLPVIVRRQQALEYGDVRLSIAQALPEEMVCSKMIRPYAAEIVLEDVSAEQVQTIYVNDITMQYQPEVTEQDAEGSAMRVNAVIEDAVINRDESYPERVTLQVSGFHPDGCKMPVQIDHQVLGSTVQVDIYRQLPPDVMCPQVLQPFEETIVLDDIALSGSVTFNINGKIIQLDM